MYGQTFRGERVVLLGLDEGFLDSKRYGTRWYETGDPSQAADALRTGRGVNVATALADRFGLRVGDVIELESPTGPLSLPIVGVVRDYMSDRGTLVVNRRMVAERWGETSVSRINVHLGADASTERVRQAIADRVGGRFRLKILTPREMIAYHAAMIRRAFGFMDAIQLLIVIVTAVGIVDLLLSAIAERRRELALWRVIGADERAVRRSVVVEALTVGGLGASLGVGVGFVTAAIWVLISYRYVLGFFLDLHFALGATVWYVLLVLMMTVGAGYVAASHATRQPIIEGVQAE
jgi:putative ABC transport system permease protein